MSRLTPVWTSLHSLFVLAIAPVALGTAVISWAEDLWLALGIAMLFAATAAVGLAFDPFIGLVVGLAGASSVVLLKQIAGAWNPVTFVGSLGEVILLFLTGAVAGFVGSRLRGQALPGRTEDDDAGSPFAGSLGILPRHMGELRFEEEVDRARRYGRALSLLRINIDMHAGEDTRAQPAEAEAVMRAVARLVENLTRVTDIPFSCGSNSFAIIFPETAITGALTLASHLVDAILTATVATRADGGRRRIGEFAGVRLGVAAYPEHGDSAEALMESALRAVRDLRESGATAPGADPKQVIVPHG